MNVVGKPLRRCMVFGACHVSEFVAATGGLHRQETSIAEKNQSRPNTYGDLGSCAYNATLNCVHNIRLFIAVDF